MMKSKVIKSPLHCIGGKSMLAGWVVSHFPPHHVFVDVFGGSGQVIARRGPNDSGLNIYNDRNESIVKVFKVLQDPVKAEKLIELLELTPYSRQFFVEVRNGAYKPNAAEDIQDVYRILVLMVQAFGGNWQNRTPSWGYMKKHTSFVRFSDRVSRFPGRLNAFLDVIKEWQVECLDFADCIERYDSPETLFYCDPPYLGKESVYEVKFSAEDHHRLSEVLHRAKGLVVLSYYDTPEVMALYPGWHCRTKESFKGSKKVGLGEKKPKSKEILLMNFDPDEHKKGMKLF